MLSKGGNLTNDTEVNIEIDGSDPLSDFLSKKAVNIV